MGVIHKLRNSESLWAYVLVAIILVIVLGLSIQTLIDRGEQARQPVDIAQAPSGGQQLPQDSAPPVETQTTAEQNITPNESGDELPTTGLADGLYAALVLGLLTFGLAQYFQSLRLVRHL